MNDLKNELANVLSKKDEAQINEQEFLSQI